MEKKSKIRFGLGSFDLVKGLAVICIILGHMSYFYDLEKMKYLMPLFLLLKPMGLLIPMFFMVSGFGFKAKSAKSVLRFTFQGLISPYLWVMLIFCILYPITFYISYGSWQGALEYTRSYLIAFLLGIPKSGKVLWGHPVMHCSAIWFFLAAFVATNIFNLILKLEKKSFQGIAVLLCVILGYFLVIRDFNYFCIAQGLVSVGYFYFGYVLKKCRVLEYLMEHPWVYLILLPVTIFHVIWGNFNLCLGEFRYGIFECIGAGCGALLLLLFGISMERFEWKSLEVIRQIGAYSYWILCIHVIEDGCMQWDIFINHMPGQGIAYFLEIILKVLIITFGCVVLKKISRYQYKRRKNKNAM